MHESYERILKALSLEKHLTARQLAQLLYPEIDPTKRYQRVHKNLQYLRKKTLLKSKSYGLGKEDFWSVAKNKLTKELGFDAPDEVHTFKYEHERDCAEVFVPLALSGRLYDWQQHKKIYRGLIPDRTAVIDGAVWYIEVERSTRDRVSEKLERYQNYFRETKQPFRVLFIVKTLRDWKAPTPYKFQTLDEFVPNPLPLQVPNEKTT